MTTPFGHPSHAGGLVFTTTPIDDIDDILAVLPYDPTVVAWVRNGDGLAGWGEAARFEVSGAERFSRTQRWWSRLCADSRVDDSVICPGSGPVAFSSFAFDQEPGYSVLIVPKVLLGHRDGKTWATIATQPGEQEPDITLRWQEQAEPGPVTWSAGTSSSVDWGATVAEAIARINNGELDKVVLARDVVGTCANPIDVRTLLSRLSDRYQQSWAFSVDGLVGATPELLVRREGDHVTSRVLAGTVRSDTDTGEQGRLAAELMGSDKDREEHAYAVASVAASLAAHCTDLDVPDQPTVLRLANVQHLATTVSGLLADEVPALALAASLHPTAAVCGTPTERAFAMIRELEKMDRARYAGPVGWMDSRGDGEFGIALRCGEIDAEDPRRIRLFAGCGIVSGSTADSEIAESEAKLMAMKAALEASA